MIKIRLALADTDLEFCLKVKDYISSIDDIEFVGIANDGLEAFKLFERKQLDVLLLHDVMPRLDGLGVLARLKNFDLFKRPKVIIINDGIADDFIKVAYKLGADYQVSRRIDIKEIINCVRMVIKKPTDNITQPHPINRNEVDNEAAVTSIMLSAGILAHIKGYVYMREAIILILKDAESVHFNTMKLYATVANMYNTSVSSVERGIRYAIEVAWDRGDIETLNENFGLMINQVKCKPKNGEFIAMIADKLRVGLKNKG